MNTIQKSEVPQWYIAYTDKKGPFHVGIVEPGCTLTTGQKKLETFSTSEAYAKRLSKLEIRRELNEVATDLQISKKEAIKLFPLLVKPVVDIPYA